MKKIVSFGIIGILLVIATFVGLRVNTAPKPTTPASEAAVATHPPTPAELLALVNDERAKNNVAPLTEDTRLDTSAQMKADDEVRYGYFGHVSPLNSPHAGESGYKFIDTTGLKCVYGSENLTENSFINDAGHAVAAWNISPSHHAAMIDPKYNLTGFGINGEQIVEHFCQTP